jgi:hypothetical protein
VHKAEPLQRPEDPIVRERAHCLGRAVRQYRMRAEQPLMNDVMSMPPDIDSYITPCLTAADAAASARYR